MYHSILVVLGVCFRLLNLVPTSIIIRFFPDWCAFTTGILMISIFSVFVREHSGVGCRHICLDVTSNDFVQDGIIFCFSYFYLLWYIFFYSSVFLFIIIRDFNIFSEIHYEVLSVWNCVDGFSVEIHFEEMNEWY